MDDDSVYYGARLNIINYDTYNSDPIVIKRRL